MTSKSIDGTLNKTVESLQKVINISHMIDGSDHKLEKKEEKKNDTKKEDDKKDDKKDEKDD